MVPAKYAVAELRQQLLMNLPPERTVNTPFTYAWQRLFDLPVAETV